MPTWDKAISLARFVAENIPHANQKINPKRRNAIDLWKYTRSIEPAFNCRLHSILLHELLLSEGIVNRFVTCHPADSEDSDCHVVNLVWLPELQKWAMLDSDMNAWAEDEKGTPLSLAEMRERYIDGREIVYRPLLNSDNDFVYYRAYWAKTYTGLILGRQQAMVAKIIILLIETIIAISCLFLLDSKVLNFPTIQY